MQLQILPEKLQDTVILNTIDFEQFHQDKASVVQETNSILSKLVKKGFIACELKNLDLKERLYTAYFDVGSKVDSVVFQSESILDTKTLEKFQIKKTKNTYTITYSLLEDFLNHLSKSFYQIGDPFATVKLSNIRQEDNFLFADLLISLSEKPRRIDQIYMKGYDKFPQGFIEHGLGLSKGDLFTEEVLTNSEAIVSSIPFVGQIKSPEVLFSKDSTYLYYFLEKKKSSFFDGMIGFTSDNEENNLIFNGYLDLRLVNIFNSGETTQIFWQNNGQNRREFKFYSQWPYVFKSKFSTELHFDLYQQDSTFNQIATLAGLSYPIKQHARIGFLFDYSKSNKLASTTTDQVQSFDRIGFRIHYNFHRPLENNLLWNKYFLETELLFANRKAETTSNEQLLLRLRNNYTFQLYPRVYLFTQFQGAYLFSDELITNEQFRIGGTETIRGFQEQVFFTDVYGIINLEARFRTNTSDYFHTVTDIAYLQNSILNSNNTLLSVGLGYVLTTKIGKIQLIYAIGKTDQQSFDFSRSAFHIKVQNNF
ncbi:hypothetical protein [Namhaeicola litoreus]|uniref:Bacterial surface antigen (D15) domain-containing protein n=1 Tax=Namhaeicola litoreus TaxID=1052145 RepID=A0ABW3Y5P9_9FLAO